MEHTHRFILMLARARLHHRAYHNLEQSAADGIHKNSYKKPDICICKHSRQNSKSDESGRARAMRYKARSLITDPVNKKGGREVHHELKQEIDRDQHRYFRKRNIIFRSEPYEQKRREVVYYRLNYVAYKAGLNCAFVFFRHFYLLKKDAPLQAARLSFFNYSKSFAYLVQCSYLSFACCSASRKSSSALSGNFLASEL